MLHPASSRQRLRLLQRGSPSFCNQCAGGGQESCSNQCSQRVPGGVGQHGRQIGNFFKKVGGCRSLNRFWIESSAWRCRLRGATSWGVSRSPWRMILNACAHDRPTHSHLGCRHDQRVAEHSEGEMQMECRTAIIVVVWSIRRATGACMPSTSRSRLPLLDCGLIQRSQATRRQDEERIARARERWFGDWGLLPSAVTGSDSQIG